jgi:hypothetical protein
MTFFLTEMVGCKTELQRKMLQLTYPKYCSYQPLWTLHKLFSNLSWQLIKLKLKFVLILYCVTAAISDTFA